MQGKKVDENSVLEMRLSEKFDRPIVRVREFGNVQPSFASQQLMTECDAYCNAQSSVLKGDAGRPSLLNKFAPSGLSAHAYRTATG